MIRIIWLKSLKQQCRNHVEIMAMHVKEHTFYSQKHTQKHHSSVQWNPWLELPSMKKINKNSWISWRIRDNVRNIAHTLFSKAVKKSHFIIEFTTNCPLMRVLLIKKYFTKQKISVCPLRARIKGKQPRKNHTKNLKRDVLGSYLARIVFQ